MRMASWLWVALLILISAPGTAAPPTQGNDSSGDAAKPATSPEMETPKYTRSRALPNAVTLATLSNGLTVIVQENHVAPVATVRCYVANTGGAFEGRYLGAGLSHVLEHVVSGGSTTRRSETQIREIINTFGGATNAYTSHDLTAFYIDCPAKDTMACIELLADSMQHCKFAPAEFSRELKVVKRELADGEADRGRVAWKLLGQTVYQESPARHPVIGYLDVLNATTNEAIIDFYRERYVPNNQVFVVVGDVKTREVLDHVARQWMGTPRGRETAVAMPAEPEQLSPREAIREMDGATYDMILAWPTIPLSHPDLYALDVAAYVLGEGESSRLVRQLKYERQLVLSVGTASYTPSFVRGWFGVMASSRPEHWKEAAEGIAHAVYRLRDELIGPVELNKAKKQKAAELIFEQQTVQQSAESLGRNFIATSDPLFDKHYVDAIQKVTAEQIRDAARRYLLPERLNRIILAPPGGAPKAGAAETAAREDEVQVERLPNGLRVLLKRHRNLPLVSMQAYVLGGSLVDDETRAGRSSLVGQMLDKGTRHMTASQIAEYFDSVGGKFSTGAGRNSVYATATVLRDDFTQAFTVFAECFTQPAFPAEEFEKVKRLALGAIERRRDNPQQEAFETFFDSLPASTPYHLIQGGKTETVQRLTVEDMRSYHDRHFVPDQMVVAVFGDVELAQALKMAQRHFGQLKRSEASPSLDFRRDNSIPKSIVRHKQTGKPTGIVVLGYPGASILDKQDEAALTLLDAIMSGYNYPGGWLFNELRGEGLVYAVDAMQVTGPAPGYFVIYAQTQPDKIAEVVTRFQRNVQRARSGQITPEEFRNAQKMVIAMHDQENTTIGAQAQLGALNELYGLGVDYDKSFAARIQAVTLADVIRVANKRFDHSVLVTTSPSAASPVGGP